MVSSHVHRSKFAPVYIGHTGCSSPNPSTQNSIPFSQFLRPRRLCWDDMDFEEKANDSFINRLYHKDIIK